MAIVVGYVGARKGEVFGPECTHDPDLSTHKHQVSLRNVSAAK